jgi:hypothetical protein
MVSKYFAKHNVTDLDHVPYSPDLSPPTFFFVSVTESVPKEQRFASTDEVIAEVKRALTKVSKNGFKEHFQKLYENSQSVSLRELLGKKCFVNRCQDYLFPCNKPTP